MFGGAVNNPFLPTRGDTLLNTTYTGEYIYSAWRLYHYVVSSSCEGWLSSPCEAPWGSMNVKKKKKRISIWGRAVRAQVKRGSHLNTCVAQTLTCLVPAYADFREIPGPIEHVRLVGLSVSVTMIAHTLIFTLARVDKKTEGSRSAQRVLKRSF